MTTIACWFNRETPESPNAWLASDGQITTDQTPSLSAAAKILQLNVSVFTWGRYTSDAPGNLPGEVRLIRSHENSVYASNTKVADIRLGFAYAGSSLVAFNTYATISFMLSKVQAIQVSSNLPPIVLKATRVTEEGVPALDALVPSIAHVLEQVSLQAGVANPKVTAELAITGYCPVDREVQIFHLVARVQDNVFKVTVSRHTPTSAPPGWVLFLGQAQAAMHDRMHLLRTRLPLAVDERKARIRRERLPLAAVLSATMQPPAGGIGGTAQLGIASCAGFSPYVLLTKEAPGHLTYLGYDVHQVPGKPSCFLPLVPLIMDVQQQMLDAELAIDEN